MVCPKCGSENVSIQAVSIVSNQKHGLIWWLCIGWWWLIIKLIGWICIGIFMLVFKLFKKNKVKTTVHSYAVCQNCGNKWKV